MSLNDVWRNLNDELGIFWKGRFDLVPAAPGVYAWFYPLRITSLDLNVFLSDVAKVFTFDARTNGPASLRFVDRLAWETIEIDLAMRPTNAPLPGEILDTWQKAITNPGRFQHLRRIVMKGSILMPPLYVGKTRSLNVRCQQHLAGGGPSTFNYRFTNFAEHSGLSISRVDDLLFACVKTGTDEPKHDDDVVAMEGIFEEILKRACRPRYSAT